MEFTVQMVLHNAAYHGQLYKHFTPQDCRNNTITGLEVLHSKNIIHTRIKASNILITTYGICKLSEPSPAVRAQDVQASMDRIVGNSHWTAPEVLQQVQ